MKITNFIHDNSAAMSSGVGAGAPVGGDLGGSTPTPVVVGIGGVPINSTPPAAGQVPTYDSGSGTIIWEAPAGGAPTGAAGGDLAGTYPNPSVAKVNGTSVPATPTAGQVLQATSGTTATWQNPVRYEVVMQPGGLVPPDPVLSPDGTDWVYATF